MLRLIVGKIVYPDQAGFVPKRNISIPKMKLLDIINHCKISTLSLSLRSLECNLFKVFDCVKATFFKANFVEI